MSKISVKQAVAYLGSGMTQKEIADLYGCSQSTISNRLLKKFKTIDAKDAAVSEARKIHISKIASQLESDKKTQADYFAKNEKSENIGQEAALKPFWDENGKAIRHLEEGMVYFTPKLEKILRDGRYGSDEITRHVFGEDELLDELCIEDDDIFRTKEDCERYLSEEANSKYDASRKRLHAKMRESGMEPSAPVDSGDWQKVVREVIESLDEKSELFYKLGINRNHLDTCSKKLRSILPKEKVFKKPREMKNGDSFFRHGKRIDIKGGNFFYHETGKQLSGMSVAVIGDLDLEVV